MSKYSVQTVSALFTLCLLSACAPQNPHGTAVIHNVQPCWSIIVGAPPVEIDVDMNRDGTIKKTEIIDTYTYDRDPTFRAAADSAVRSLNHVQCRLPKLPPDKYEEWKHLELTFDPEEML